MFFQRFFLTVGGDGMEIKVQRRTVSQAGVLDLSEPGSHQTLGRAVVDAGDVGSQVGAFGNDIQAGEQGNTFIRDQVHDMAVAFLADEFESEEGADGLRGWDHVGAGQPGSAKDCRQTDVTHERHEEEQAAQTSTEGAWFQVQGADIGDRGRFGLDRGWSFVVAAAWQACEAFLAEEEREGVDTEVMTGVGQFALDVVDR